MNDVVPMAEERPYPHQQGTWTLTAPDGRQWQAEVRCSAAVRKTPSGFRLSCGFSEFSTA